MYASTIGEPGRRGSALLLAHCFSFDERLCVAASAAERLVALLGGDLAQRLVFALSRSRR